ncbi:MAG: LysR family transcriptional regulator [Nitratireductor sp.]|nr:LysR family transcriptional regulator [Nitratireductor sp.]
MFDWNLIRSFLAILDEGSLAAASRKTGISQPTLGRHVDELEASLGVTLFQRGRSGMAAAPAALELAESAREMERASADISLTATGASQQVGGVVRITASDIVATYLLPPIIADLMRDLPEVEIELAPSNTVENLLRRDADIAIRMVRPAQNDLIARQVNAFEMGIYAHSAYLERTGTPDDFEALSGHTLIGYDRSDLILRGFAEHGYKVDRSFFRFRCDNQITAFEVLVAGAGIGFAPNALARRHPGLQRILPDIPIEGLPMWLTSHRELRTSRRIRRVSDYLGEKLSELDLR